MKLLYGKEAIDKILDSGGFPEPDLPHGDFSREVLESFYNLSILELWEYLSELDFVPSTPLGLDANLLYKKPFGKDTEYFLQKCLSFEGLPILNSELPDFAVQKHLLLINEFNDNEENSCPIPCLNCKHIYNFKNSVFDELSKCIRVLEYELSNARSKGNELIKEIDGELLARIKSVDRLISKSKMAISDDTMIIVDNLQEENLVSTDFQLATDKKQIESLRQWNKQFLTQRAELRKALDEKDARIAQLERALATAKAEPVTTVNAAKWEGSVAAAFGVWADIVAGNKTDWKEDEFRSAIEARCTDYHTKVHAIAWNLLPDEFKNGRGRPKKKPEKSQQPDNS